MAESFGAQETTRRTLLFYWLVARKHLWLYVAMLLSAVGYIALLSYGNPYVMSLVVDRISAEPVAADQVFTGFG